MSVTRSALEVSDYEEVQGDKFNISYTDDIETYNISQFEIKSTCKRTIPEIFNGEETGNDKDLSKCELVATLISEIAHKAGKEKTNQLLRLIGSDFNLTDFNSKFQDADACHRYVDEYVMNTLQEDGFMEQVIDDPVSGLKYSIFSRDPSLVIRRQVSAANPRNCFFSPVKVVRNGQKCYPHPLDTPAGHKVYNSVKKAVMSSNDTNVFWKSILTQGSESFAGITQMYSDKSSVTLKARGFQFYPIHLVLLNLSEKLRRRMITSGGSIVGYLPVSFQSGEQFEMKPQKTLRKQVLLSLHGAVRKIFEPLALCAEEGIACRDSEGTARTCHVAIGAYCSDIPEAKDITRVLHGSSTASTCFRLPCSDY